MSKWQVGPYYKTDVHDEDGHRVAEGLPAHTETGAVRARLIAAAPELLARLKRRRADCDCEINVPDYIPRGQAVCPECKADAALIAKAEGSSI